MVELNPYLYVLIALLILIAMAYTLVYYRIYLRSAGGGDGPGQSTLLDGLILIAIVIVLAGGGSPTGQLAVEVTIFAVAIIALLRGLQSLARAAANRRTELERRPSK